VNFMGQLFTSQSIPLKTLMTGLEHFMFAFITETFGFQGKNKLFFP